MKLINIVGVLIVALAGGVGALYLTDNLGLIGLGSLQGQAPDEAAGPAAPGHTTAPDRGRVNRIAQTSHELLGRASERALSCDRRATGCAHKLL